MQFGKTLVGAIIGAVLGIGLLIAVYLLAGIDKMWMAIPVAILTGIGVRMVAATSGHASYLRGAITVVLAMAAGTVAGVAADLLIVAAMVYEWRKNGRPHRVYWIAGGAIIIVQVLRIPMSTTGAWADFAQILSSLAQ